MASEDLIAWATSGLYLRVFWLSKTGGRRGENNELLIFFLHFSLWAFAPPLMILGRSQCFAVYCFATQMKGLVGPLISSFSAQTANIVLFGFMTWSFPGGRDLKRASPSLHSFICHVGAVCPWVADAPRCCDGDAQRQNKRQHQPLSYSQFNLICTGYLLLKRCMRTHLWVSNNLSQSKALLGDVCHTSIFCKPDNSP